MVYIMISYLMFSSRELFASYSQLVSSAGTGYFYTTRRNISRTPEKFKFVKFDPIVRRKVLFTESKIK